MTIALAQMIRATFFVGREWERRGEGRRQSAETNACEKSLASVELPSSCL
jgi:hypothetical protein